MPSPGKRATLREVAEATGLSTAAVSYALRGLQVSEETMRRVRAAADELGYEANPIARALAGGRTGLVGVLCGSLEDLWQQRLAAGIGRALLANDRYALILEAGGDPDRELVVARQLCEQRVDGLIVSPIDPSAKGWAQVATIVPIVSIGDSLAAARNAGAVLFDNRAGVTLALEHLARLGHRAIAVLTPSHASTPDRPAEAHVTAEAQRLRLRTAVVTSGAALPDATAAAVKVLRGRPRPTALFCFSDSIAHGSYAAAAELGLRVPADLSIMGYDAHPVSGLLNPPLTTVDWDLDDVVASASRMILEAITGTGRRQRLTRRPTLLERASTAPPGHRPTGSSGRSSSA